MRKQDARNKARDRAPTRYPKSAVTVLLKIIDLIRVDDPRTSHIEEFFSTSKTLDQLAFLTNLSRRTVHTSLTQLERDGVIAAHARDKHSFRVNPEALQMFESKYVTTRTRSLEVKILNAIRMKFQRNPGRVPEWASVHPEQCKCEPHFCSHPSAAIEM